MGSPSDALLTWLRDIINQKGLNTAAVADLSGLARPRVRRVLSGREPMLVDELLKLCEALEVTPSDMGLPGGEDTGDPGDDDTPDLGVDLDDEDDDEDESEALVDPFGNHPRQLFQIGFGLGCDFLFFAKAGDLGDSGVPESVLAQYEGRDLPIKLDAAYHRYNKPVYAPDGITLTLSFDALYTCRFPWTAIKQVVFFPATPEPPADTPEPDEGDGTAKGAPFLRLVE